MDKIKIIGVPEHFNFPWVKTVEEQPLKEQGILLEWMDEPKGSGAMNKAIRNNEADVAVILTESFIKDCVEGNPGRIIGYHVRSPLIWGIHVSSQYRNKSLADLQNVPYLISRYGSGSHLMPFLLARKMGWNREQLEFEVVGDLEGAKSALADPDPKVFLWEKFMTKPFVDVGLFHRVGEIPTPWPCFVIVASPNALKHYPEQIKSLRDQVYKKASVLLEDDGLSLLLSQKYNILEQDIRSWLSQTQWATDNVVASSTLETTMDELISLQLIERKVPMEALVEVDFVKLA